MTKLSPARAWAARKQREKQQAAAKAAVESADPGAVTELTTTAEGFEALCMAMSQDVLWLHGKTLTEKQEFKVERLPGYMEHVQEYMASGDVYANPVIVETMIWLADLLQDGHPASNAVEFEKIALLCVSQGQKMPERFKSSLPTFVADAVHAWASHQIKLNHSPQPLFGNIFNQLHNWPVPRGVIMKYHKLAGQLATDAGEWKTAYILLTKADMLGTPKHPAKVTTIKKEVVKNLEKLGIQLPAVSLETEQPAPDAPDTDDDTE
ncbi:phage terminase small subunit [Oceanobacter sp. 4_MG-2023]|uniref:phage terminase small subunit n=1 Tax=Oceanobacter sp. 4_MG-2023 TaxID=3062623 RepID=UPI0027339FBD|nr:phage terminase small subunit [Oceanobacter sp. 4_MG-2023]MDP2548891.1 phage terminase small subunit [Oceanobacter sp. 4_MG-2023]